MSGLWCALIFSFRQPSFNGWWALNLKFMSRSVCYAFPLILILGWPTTALADQVSIIVQSTTSTANSGLYDHLLPRFEKEHAIVVHVVPVGTGQAIRNAMRGDADVLLVHAKAAEERFIQQGYGVTRFDLMYNDFVLVGPSADPARVLGAHGVTEVLSRITASGVLFASRGDDSGTHQAELSLWRRAKIDPAAASGTWYRETGSGMGATLNAAVGMGAYTLSDRASWVSFKNKGGFRVLFEGDPSLFNQYGIILVNPARHAHVKAQAGQKFINWMISDEGQAQIAAYRRNGQQLFFPNAVR